VPRDASDDPVTVARTVEVWQRDCATQLQAPIGGVHPGAATLYLDCAEKGVDATRENLLDDSRPAVTPVTRHLHAQPVAVHHATHLRRRQEHTLGDAFDAQESVAGAVGTDRTLDDGARPNGRIRTPRAWAAWRRAAASAARGGRCRGLPAVRRAFARLGRCAAASAATPELSSTSLQLTAPEPVRTLRGLPHLPGWRNW